MDKTRLRCKELESKVMTAQEAAKIFEEVESSGTKIVMKNSKPSCVLLSPIQYESIMEMLSDYLLIIEAKQRIEQNDDDSNISHDELMKQLGIEQADLDKIKEKLSWKQ